MKILNLNDYRPYIHDLGDLATACSTRINTVELLVQKGELNHKALHNIVRDNLKYFEQHSTLGMKYGTNSRSANVQAETVSQDTEQSSSIMMTKITPKTKADAQRRNNYVMRLWNSFKHSKSLEFSSLIDYAFIYYDDKKLTKHFIISAKQYGTNFSARKAISVFNKKRNEGQKYIVLDVIGSLLYHFHHKKPVIVITYMPKSKYTPLTALSTGFDIVANRRVRQLKWEKGYILDRKRTQAAALSSAEDLSSLAATCYATVILHYDRSRNERFWNHIIRLIKNGDKYFIQHLAIGRKCLVHPQDSKAYHSISMNINGRKTRLIALTKRASDRDVTLASCRMHYVQRLDKALHQPNVKNYVRAQNSLSTYAYIFYDSLGKTLHYILPAPYDKNAVLTYFRQNRNSKHEYHILDVAKIATHARKGIRGINIISYMPKNNYYPKRDILNYFYRQQTAE